MQPWIHWHAYVGERDVASDTPSRIAIMEMGTTAASTNDAPSNGAEDAPAVTIAIVDGDLVVYAPSPTGAPAELSWVDEEVEVVVGTERARGGSTRIGPDSPAVTVRPIDVEARCEYVATVASNRMQASLRVRTQPGRRRTPVDAAPSTALRIRVVESPIDPPEPNFDDAMAAVVAQNVTSGVDEAAVAAACEQPNAEQIVAVGREAEPGEDGSIEALIDFAAVRTSGVPEGTQLVRRRPKRDGVPGTDVQGRTLTVRPVRDVRIKPGPGVSLDEEGLVATATLDGLPVFDGDCMVEVREELEVDEVGTELGDIDFCGSVRVRGDVHEGRKVVARRQLIVEGNVDRARLDSGDRMEVHGSVMSSVLRAGGARAVAASVIDRVEHAPNELAQAAIRARELRDAAEQRGGQLSHGHSIQLVVERMYKPLLTHLAEAAKILRESGAEYAAEAQHFEDFRRQLTTAGGASLTAEQFMTLLNDIGRMVDDMRRSVEHSADLVVHYMQACEVEATGTVTLNGKGIFNSRIVAWGGLIAEHHHAVVRGGSILAHGPVQVAELGSPGGSTMQVQLAGAQALLAADIVYSGTLVTGPGGSHRFIADRSNVRVSFRESGMEVESLAA